MLSFSQVIGPVLKRINSLISSRALGPQDIVTANLAILDN
jgi:hypothetical protein